MVWEVKVMHHKSCYRRGDEEAEDVLHEVKHFKTRAAGKEWIQKELRGKKDKWESWHRGKASYAGYYTGHKWIHENTGDEHKESYNYTLNKLIVNK